MCLIKIKCVSLKWIKPKHFIDKTIEDAFFGNKENEIIENFMLFEKEKNIRKKFMCINKISKIIPSIDKINSLTSNGYVDNVISWRYYFFIKAQPLRAYSNVKFIELYIRKNKDNLKEQILLSEFQSISEEIPNMKHYFLRNISYEEFQKNCDSSKIENSL